MKLLSILMPVYNERMTLEAIVRRVLAITLPIPFELVVVDDGSTDGSRQILADLAAADPRIKVVLHAENAGKGAAIHTAIANMAGDIAIVQDADLEYDPAEIGKLIAPILNGTADAVLGSRFAGSECRRMLYYWHSLGNRFLTFLTNVICDLNYSDMETCYKAVRSDILRQTRLVQKDFGLEPELAIRLSQWGARIYEVAISYTGRTYEEGKKITWRDGVKALWVIFLTGVLDTQFTTHEGFYKLKTGSKARAFNKWLFEQIKPHVGRRVLEVGCGIGTLTTLMLGKDCLVCADIDPFYMEIVERRFGHLKGFAVRRMDVGATDDYKQLSGFDFDTIICTNVLEHLENDQAVLTSFIESLNPGGKAIVVVPQHPWLYTRIDKSSGNCRRYSVEQITERMRRAGFEIAETRQFNRLGSLGWFVFGKILGKSHVGMGDIGLCNLLMPLARVIEMLPMWPAMSLIVAGQKPAAAKAAPAPVEEVRVDAIG